MKRIFSLILLLLLVLLPVYARGEAAGVIDLYLEENPSTGYVWTAASTDESIARVESVPEATADIGEDHGYGESHNLHLRITGGQPGTAQVSFTYARPWESVQPLAGFTLTVTVDRSGELLSEITLAAHREDSWLCSQEERLEFDPNAQVCRLATQDLPDGEERIIAAETDSPRGFAFDFRTENGVTRLYSVNYYLSLLPLDGSVPFAPEFLFSTTDLEGSPITEQIFAGQKLTILNFWEPWCGPCVGEMPHLQKLSQEYADDILILGIYATPNAEEEVQLVLESTGVTYPIAHYTDEFAFLQTGYVPTTVVINQSGAIVKDPFAGALRYDDWVKLVEGLL